MSSGVASAAQVTLPADGVVPRNRPLAQAAIGGILILTILGPYMTMKPEPFTGEGSPLRQFLYLVCVLAAIASTRFWAEPRRLLAVPLTLVLALGWCWLSVTWAADPSIAVRRLVLTTLLIIAIFTAIRQAGYTATLSAARWVLITTLVANYLTVALFPSVGIHQYSELLEPGLIGNWRGVLPQKNFAGAICSFTLLILIIDPGRIRGATRWLLVFATLFFLLKTMSKTSMGIGLLGLLVAAVYRSYNPAYRALLIPVFAVVAAGAALLTIVYFDDIIAPLSDPGALTGRGMIWPPLLVFASDHPITGAGYGSFWNIGAVASPINQYAKGWVTHITSGHNGYLDVLVQVGIPGLALTVFALIVVPIVRLLASTAPERQRGALLLAMITFCAGHNMTESTLMDRDAIVQVFLLTAIALIGVVGDPPEDDKAPARD
ncbi:O-antigen ligase family protein [Sphingomonas sp. ID0503]|uniref:O-antigen ligase family protein n=1 Tax=Sphingomonas sp. ID0503 TaxID=3399691 RepID=UPI003AFB201F